MTPTTPLPDLWRTAWPAGTALGHYLRSRPELVAGRRVVDFGAGTGHVSLVARDLGATVHAIDSDPAARSHLVELGLDTSAPARFDLGLIADLFYAPCVAAAALEFINRTPCLVADVQRRYFPKGAWPLVAEYRLQDAAGVHYCGIYRANF